MTTDTRASIEWNQWRDRWEAQQAAYTVDWEGRYSAMLDALAALLPEPFVALDLASGPGTISRRILDRFPAARCIALDLDPVTLAMGEATLGDAGGRLRWVDADLMVADWRQKLNEDPLDAVLSSTALHWLPAEHLLRVYRELAEMIRPGGLFLNADNMRFGAEAPSFSQLAQWRKGRLSSAESLAARGQESWQQWWDALALEQAAAPLLAERQRRFGWMDEPNGQPPSPSLDLHIAALRDAGFREVGTIWQSLTNRVLMAVR